MAEEKKELPERDIEDQLRGDDDGGVYFLDKQGREWYVHGYEELIKKLVEVCEKFFEEYVEKR